MIAKTYVDIELMCRDWLRAGPVGALTTNIFQSMPASSPVPSVIGQRVGGAPMRNEDLPADRSRMSWDCWHTNRPDCYALSAAVITEIENLSQTGGYKTFTGLLLVGEVIGWHWLPDPASDTPRYIVDALMVAVAV
jgi:hypothetical protein